MVSKSVVALIVTGLITIVSMFTIADTRVTIVGLVIVSGLGGFAVWRSNNSKKGP